MIFITHKHDLISVVVLANNFDLQELFYKY